MNIATRGRRRVIFVATGSICLLSVVGLTIAKKASSKQPQVLTQNNKDSLLKFVENSSDLPMRVAGNDDCPLRIMRAAMKEISGPDFSRLTGRTTDRVTVSSVPEVSLVNTSGETITGFILVVRDPQSRTTRGFVQEKVSVDPGSEYLVKREHFLEPERVTFANEQGVVSATKLPGLDSEKYWLGFAEPSDIFLTVGRVTFKNGRNWTIKEGGEVR
ncbi:MAG TPA: hypothetical protein DC054_09305 [Blastocatellia bacterium]|nr:hypothetical protein [Blastocatellia bacterium]